MKRLLAVALLALAGCGSDDAAPEGVDESDKRAVALACIEEAGVEARLQDENTILLDSGPHIRFYLTAAEAEAAQFRGEGEGAEQIGAALLFVEPETSPRMDDILGDVEKCLADQ